MTGGEGKDKKGEEGFRSGKGFTTVPHCISLATSSQILESLGDLTRQFHTATHGESPGELGLNGWANDECWNLD